MTRFRLSLPLALFVFAIGVAAQQALPDPVDGVISGTVYDGSTHQPIAGVVVTLMTWGAPSDDPGNARVTDEKGRFVFEGVRRFVAQNGRREQRGLTAQKPGYLEGWYGRDGPVLGAFLDNVFGMGFAPILVASGQWMESADITLWPAASVSGTIMDEYGEPFVDQLVRVLARDPVAGHPRWSNVGTVLTDDRGRYFVGRLAPGRYVIAAPAAAPRENGDGPLRPGRYYPGALGLADAVSVVVTAGAHLAGLDIARLPTPASRVSGQVTGDAGQNWPRLLLALTVAGDPDIGPAGYVATALLEPSGTFVFPRVPPGDYVIRTSPSVGKDGFPVETFGNLPTAGPRWSVPPSPDAVSAPLFAQTPVTVGAADVANVPVALRHSVALSGILTSDEPTVMGPLGPMMPYVFAEPADSDAGPASGRSAVDPSGVFLIDGLAPGRYFLRTWGSRGLARSILVAGHEMLDQPIDVSESVSGVAVSATGFSSLHGEVRIGNSRASVLHTVVIYFPKDRQLWSQVSSKSSRFGRLYVNTDGTYDTSPSIPGGEYYIVAIPQDSHFDEWHNEAFLDAASRVATTVRVDWAQRVQQDLQVREVRVP